MKTATWNGATIAQSDQTIVVEGYHYFPPDSIRSEFVRESSTTSRCPWKGTARYYSLQVDGKTNEDAAWYYPEPSSGAANLKDYVAFWKGVTVSRITSYNYGVEESEMEQSHQIGDRISDKSAPPDDAAVREWIGAKAHKHWAELQNWIDEYYPGVFAPEWLYGGQKRGWCLRYKKTKAFCTLIPEYKLFSAAVVMGGAEREKFEERRLAWRAPLVKLYDEAKTYIDGKWLTVGISSTDDLQDVKDLLTMKRPSPRLQN